MNVSYNRYYLISLVLCSMVATTVGQTWTELFNKSLGDVTSLTQSALTTIQKNNGVMVAKDFVMKHPVISALCVSIASYGLYRLVKPSKAPALSVNTDLFEAHTKAEKNLKRRLKKALDRMDISQETPHNELELSMNILQEFKNEIDIQFSQSVEVQKLRPFVHELLSALQTYLNSHYLGREKEDCFDALQLNYVLLKSMIEVQ